MEPRIVCAANLNTETGEIILGARHWDEWMHKQADVLERKNPENKRGWIRAEQGFIDQFGKFYSREEAWAIAEKNGQIIREVCSPGVLFSENLY